MRRRVSGFMVDGRSLNFDFRQIGKGRRILRTGVIAVLFSQRDFGARFNQHERSRTASRRASAYRAPTQSAIAEAISSSWALVTLPRRRTNRFSESDLV